MKTLTTLNKTTRNVSQRYLDRNYYKDQEWVNEITKRVQFENVLGELQIGCNVEFVVCDGRLYVSKESVKSEIRRILKEGSHKNPNSLIVLGGNRKQH